LPCSTIQIASEGIRDSSWGASLEAKLITTLKVINDDIAMQATQ